MGAKWCLRLFGVLTYLMVIVYQVKSSEPASTLRQLNDTLLDMAASFLTNLNSNDGSNSTTDMMMLLDELSSNNNLPFSAANNLAEMMNGKASSNSNTEAALATATDNTSFSPSENETGSYDGLSKYRTY